MKVLARQSGAIKLVEWSLLWRGRGRTWPGLVKMFGVWLRLLLAGWLWNTAIQLAHIQEPMKTVGAILALGAAALFVWAVRGLWQGAWVLGVKRLVTILLALGLLVATFNALTIRDDDRPFFNRWITQLEFTGQQGWDQLVDALQSLVRAPEELLFAYTGQRARRLPPPSIPTPNPQSTPIEFTFHAAGEAVPSPQLTIGNYARVANTDGQALRARSGPGTSYEIAARFPEGTRLLILDGPTVADGYRWWKVHGGQGEGWCADRWLAVSP